MDILEIWFRRGTEAEWKRSNRVLSAGEPGYATDTKVLRIGDGIRRWTDLPAFLSESAVQSYILEKINELPTGGSEPDLPDLVLYYENTKA